MKLVLEIILWAIEYELKNPGKKRVECRGNGFWVCSRGSIFWRFRLHRNIAHLSHSTILWKNYTNIFDSSRFVEAKPMDLRQLCMMIPKEHINSWTRGGDHSMANAWFATKQFLFVNKTFRALFFAHFVSTIQRTIVAMVDSGRWMRYIQCLRFRELQDWLVRNGQQWLFRQIRQWLVRNVRQWLVLPSM